MIFKYNVDVYLLLSSEYKTCFNFQIVICLVAFGALCAALPQQQTPRPEITDEALDSTLNDSRYLMRQLKCALGEAPCDPVGRRLKSKRSLPTLNYTAAGGGVVSIPSIYTCWQPLSRVCIDFC